MTSGGLAVHEFTVALNEGVADGLMRIVISAPELAAALAPGQFVNIHVPGDASQILRVPLSFSHADAAAGTVDFQDKYMRTDIGRRALRAIVRSLTV